MSPASADEVEMVFSIFNGEVFLGIGWKEELE